MRFQDFTHVNSPFVSKHYPIFCELGYPQLDVVEFKDGEWAIIEMINSPVVPSLTKWHYVLKGLRNIEVNPSFLRKYVHKIDLTMKEFWANEDAKEANLDYEHAAKEKHAEEYATRAAKAISKNEALLERIAKNGLAEMNLGKIANNIEPWTMRGMGYKNI